MLNFTEQKKANPDKIVYKDKIINYIHISILPIICSSGLGVDFFCLFGGMLVFCCCFGFFTLQAT